MFLKAFQKMTFITGHYVHTSFLQMVDFIIHFTATKHP